MSVEHAGGSAGQAAPPRVSIGLPVYNGQDFLRDALDSLLGQSFTDLEVIICDNASTDDTRAICEHYAARDARIRYHRNETNLGAAKNYNLAFERARGEFFKWASHDDLCEPSYIEKCVDAFDNGPEGVVLVYGRTMMIGPDNEAIEPFDDRMHLPHATARARVAALLRNIVLCNPVFGLIRADALRGTTLIGPYLGSDRVLLAELALRGKFVELPERLFHRRVHDKMSHKANRNDRDISVWFDPSNRDRRLMPRCRLLTEHLRAVRDAGIRGPRRLVCSAQVAGIMLRRHGRAMGGEVKAIMKDWVSGRGGPHPAGAHAPRQGGPSR